MHDEVYDAVYYQKYTAEMEHSAIGMVLSIVRHLSPRTAVDIGCGSGEVLMELVKGGIEAEGFDLSDAALSACRAKGLRVGKFDLEDERQKFTVMADLAISTEVADTFQRSLLIATWICCAQSGRSLLLSPPRLRGRVGRTTSTNSLPSTGSTSLLGKGPSSRRR